MVSMQTYWSCLYRFTRKHILQLNFILFISCVGGEATHEVRDGKCDSPGPETENITEPSVGSCEGEEGVEYNVDLDMGQALHFQCGDGCIKIHKVYT